MTAVAIYNMWMTTVLHELKCLMWSAPHQNPPNGILDHMFLCSTKAHQNDDFDISANTCGVIYPNRISKLMKEYANTITAPNMQAMRMPAFPRLASC